MGYVEELVVKELKMLEFVKKDKLEMVSNKIKNIYDKRIGNKKDDFINNFVDRYKDHPAVYNNDFYKDNSELMKIDAMFYYLSRADIICSITDGTDTLTVIDVKEL